jgi:hypothetical protein
MADDLLAQSASPSSCVQDVLHAIVVVPAHGCLEIERLIENAPVPRLQPARA